MNLIRCANGHMYSARKHGKVCPYCNVSGNEPKKSAKRSGSTISGTSEEGNKTTGVWGDPNDNEPVVGWIACIEGPERGRDYRIRPEKNFIGRSEEMHIYIAADTAISRRNHAIISYNPQGRNFHLIPGDGVGIVYHNNDAVYSPTELNAYDVIQMGKSKFIFIPLCGIHFEWESEEDKE